MSNVRCSCLLICFFKTLNTTHSKRVVLIVVVLVAIVEVLVPRVVRRIVRKLGGAPVVGTSEPTHHNDSTLAIFIKLSN